MIKIDDTLCKRDFRISDNMGRFRNWEQQKFDKKGLTKWNRMCQHPEGLKVGRFVDIGAFTYINAKNGVDLDGWVHIGSHCSIYSESTIDGRSGRVPIREARVLASIA